ncbi:L-lysine 6-transaminase [Fadolivirus algeromassiliense]|jgi:L-lysine 6-transaminase|uniref:L-lysine-epsilon aminotransferase n=1 Tax=Fadolivirus FV1/VV64 TaxID=3070911 RepID=A0A7D3URF9_9VIRU|nr:L-lysine 6-transaminase [Fadolivirus algeromassiliense]QKF94613.1 L-lysine 6-transaminase [Fadolivirus FV1/VV64]
MNILRVALTRQAVNNITPMQVHPIIKKNMLVKGYDLVYDMKKSHGSYIIDAKSDKKFLDMFSFYGSWPVAHDHRKLVNDDFIREIGEIAIHNPSNSDIYTEEYAKFIATFERVCMPSEFKHLFLISGGTLAVENALKVAFDWKVRKNLKAGKGELGSKVIHFKEAFHGRSGYALSLTNTDPAKYLYYPLFAWPRILNPKIKFPLDETNLEKVINDENYAIDQIEHILKTDGDDIACIILEPIQGEGGDNHFRPEFWKKLKELSIKYDVMLISDEVQTGMGLTGKLWAYEHLGATPDIIVFGKKTQVCGIMCTDRIDEVEDNVFKVPSRINSTWGGSLVDMVRSRRLIEIIEEENLIDNAKVVGNYALYKMYKLQYQFPNLVSNVRGKGLMIAFDLPNKDMCEKLKTIAYDNGLIIISCGNSSIRLRPMLDIKCNDIDLLYGILYKCLNELK